MQHHELTIEVESRCISIWKEPLAKRSARVTLLVEFNDQIVIVVGTSNGFWFLPGGGVERNESVEETAKREATEELGLEIAVNRIIKTFHVTLISEETGERFEIHPFIAVHATPLKGQLKAEYGPKRKIFLVGKDKCDNLLRDFKIPEEYECMKPYHYVSREIIGEFWSR